MLKAPRVPIAVVFSAPPTSPLSLKGGAVKCQILWTWCDYKCVFLPLISYHANNNTGCVVVRTWVYIRIVVGWLECKGEEEGRSNRDLIEWLPGKLVYSRFLLTTCRPPACPLAMPPRMCVEFTFDGCLMCGCGGNLLNALSYHLPNAIAMVVLQRHAVVMSGVWSHWPYHAPVTSIELQMQGCAKKIICMNTIKAKKVASDINRVSSRP